MSETSTEVGSDGQSGIYQGYREFASFVASDPDFFVLRRFDKLNARVLLTLQDNLSELEQKLEKLDTMYGSKDATDISNGTVRYDVPDRKVLLEEISKKLQEYNRLLLDHTNLKVRPLAPKRSLVNIDNWFWDNPNAIIKEERGFITHKEDLISVDHYVARTSILGRLLETYVTLKLDKLWYKLGPSNKRHTEHGVRVYTSTKRVNAYHTVYYFVIALSLLVVPIWILSIFENTSLQLALCTAFTLLFMILVFIGTEATSSEMMTASATYAAVLMGLLSLRSNIP